jgi:hypothetical protein
MLQCSKKQDMSRCASGQMKPDAPLSSIEYDLVHCNINAQRPDGCFGAAWKRV